MATGPMLFGPPKLADALDDNFKKIEQEIEQIFPDKIIDTDAKVFASHFQKKYAIEELKLHEDKISTEPREAKFTHGYRQVSGVSITCTIPFSGPAWLFGYGPSAYSGFPNGVVEGSNLLLVYETQNPELNQIHPEHERDLGLVRKNVEWINADLKKYFDSIPNFVLEKINARRDKILKGRKLALSMGYPLKQRTDVPNTYSVPLVRKKILAVLPPSSTQTESEPRIELAGYDAILSIMWNMARVMELSPSVFTKIKEEDLRVHFLVQLNAQFEGNATGETFNLEGKTDILIRDKGKNLFIAECKFWDGPKSLTDAITQLLGYISWRDSKTAVVLFNRNRDFSKVLEQIPAIVISHPNFKEELGQKSDSEFRYKFSNNLDKSKDVYLAVLAFDIPA